MKPIRVKLGITEVSVSSEVLVPRYSRHLLNLNKAYRYME